MSKIINFGFMKSIQLLLIASGLLLFSCGQSGHHHDQEAGEAIKSDANGALSGEVSKIHDEAMEKMGAMYRLKGELQAKLSEASVEEKVGIEMAIAKLDSADKNMRDWMHHFRASQDSLSDEEYREYLEAELIKVKSVRESILEALKGANE